MIYGGAAYIITNKENNVLYTGVTSNLVTRIWQHRNREYPKSFSAKYNCFKLVWYESFSRIEEAIAKEKQIKAGKRNDKIILIQMQNPEWKDLWEEIQKW